MNYRLHQLSLLSVCLSLAACGSWFKPATLPAAPAMTEMQNQPGAEIDTQWWALFNDPELNRLMAQMEQGNLNVQLMAAKVRQAQAALASAQSSFSPSVSLSVQVSATTEGVLISIGQLSQFGGHFLAA